MKNYESPIVELIELNTVDVIATSVGGEENPEDAPETLITWGQESKRVNSLNFFN